MTAKQPGKYEDILDAATDLFLEYGFQDVSVTRIMERAECSRETVYRYFDNKETIFQAVIDNQMSSYLNLISSFDVESEDLRQGILNWSNTLLKMAASEKYIKLRRLVISEISTRPEHGKLYFSLTYQRGTEAVARFFEAQQKQNKLKKMDPYNLATYFVGMLMYEIMHERLFGLCKPPGNKQIKELTTRVVDDFLEGFGADTG